MVHVSAFSGDTIHVVLLSMQKLIGAVFQSFNTFPVDEVRCMSRALVSHCRGGCNNFMKEESSVNNGKVHAARGSLNGV